MARGDTERSRLDLAARAGWLYFIAGNTQEEIARKLKVSRPTAQRLVSLALSERLITFRLEHPIAACMQLATQLSQRYGLFACEVVPTDPASTNIVVTEYAIPRGGARELYMLRGDRRFVWPHDVIMDNKYAYYTDHFSYVLGRVDVKTGEAKEIPFQILGRRVDLNLILCHVLANHGQHALHRLARERRGGDANSVWRCQ